MLPKPFEFETCRGGFLDVLNIVNDNPWWWSPQRELSARVVAAQSQKETARHPLRPTTDKLFFRHFHFLCSSSFAMAEEDPVETHPLLGDNSIEDIPVYPIIHMIRQVCISRPECA